MRRAFALLILALPLVAVTPMSASAAPLADPIIIDTDFGQWWDDVAALAAAHTAADQGKARILGVVSDVDNEWNAPALDALNTWYGRPGIPIGVTAGAVPVAQNYSQMLAERFPHSGGTEEAVALYRRLLRGGHNVVTPDGLNHWADHGHDQQYLLLTDAARLTRKLDALIDAH